MRTGGKILIDQLIVQGCEAIFTVPGESFLPALDALFDAGPIRTIICRHESGAAMMAEATGKLTGAPGVAFVTRAPGATNAASGVYIAHHDSSPMLLLVGLNAQTHAGRQAFQEIDLATFFGGFTKWVGIVRSPERIPEYVARAFHTALSGRPGPVVLGFPEEVLAVEANSEDAAPATVPRPQPSAADMARLRTKLSDAQRPMLIVGGAGWSREAAEDLKTFAETFDVPVASAFRRQDHFDNRHPSYVGHLGIDSDQKLGAAVRSADVLVVVGETPAEVTTAGYTLLTVPEPAQFLVHAHPSSSELGRIFKTNLPVHSTPTAFARALSRLKPPANRRWARLRQDLRGIYERSLKPKVTPGNVRLEEVIEALSSELPEDAIITNGAGNYTTWVHRFHQYRKFRTQLAPTAGSMGYGVPAAVAAKAVHPTRTVVAFAGDGCFLMNGQELATAVQYGLAVIFIVVNNGMYGTIRAHQEREYPGRESGTGLVNPDFAALARAYGAHGATVEKTTDFAGAFEAAAKSNKPALIEIKLDPEAISPRMSLTQIRERALAGR
jgi:acetolactate synthase-1/2/3 large subunit